MDNERSSELEKTQQQITLNLQEIDENFAKCTQVVAAKIMPELERFAEATEEIWESTKTWLYFFKVAGQTLNHNNTTSTNRPPFSPQERLVASNINMKDMNGARSISRNYGNESREPGSIGSIRTNYIMNDIKSAYNKNSLSNPSTPRSIDSRGALLDELGNIIASPPRTRQFTPITSNTPIREAVGILAEHSIRRVREDLTESSEEEPRRTSRIEQNMEPTDIFASGKDDTLRRAEFLRFFKGRQTRIRNMKEYEELPRIRQVAKSPSNRQSRSYHEEKLDLVSTPIVDRVLSDRGKDLRSLQSQTQDEESEDYDFKNSEK